MKSIRQVTTKATKHGDNSDVFQFQLWEGSGDGNSFDEAPINLTGAIATVQVSNDSGFVAQKVVGTIPKQGIVEINMGLAPFTQLPSGSYQFQVEVARGSKKSYFPTDGGQSIRVYKNLMEQKGELIPTVSFDTVLKSVDDKIKIYMNTVSKGDTGPQGPRGIQGIPGKDGTNGLDTRTFQMRTGTVWDNHDFNARSGFDSPNSLTTTWNYYYNINFLNAPAPNRTGWMREITKTSSTSAWETAWSGTNPSERYSRYVRDYTSTPISTTPWVKELTVADYEKFTKPKRVQVPLSGRFTGINLNFSQSGNVVTVQLAGSTADGVVIDGGDIVIGSIPASISNPPMTQNGLLVNVSQPYQGSLRATVDGKINWNISQDFRGSGSHYWEGAITYITNDTITSSI